MAYNTITSVVSLPPALNVCYRLDGTHLNLDGPEVLTDIVWLCLVF